MNKAIKHILMMSGGKRKYGTAGTTTTTPLASQGGLLINIDSATGDIAQTGTGWIEDEKYGFNAREFATSTSAEFDTAVLRTGTKTLKLSTLDATGIIRCFPFPGSNYSTAATNLANSHYFIPCKPSTKYRFRCFCKTTNVAATSTSISLTEIGATGTAGVANGTNTLSGTNDWTLLQANFTTAASAVWLGFGFFISVAGNVSDAWFDVNSMTLEEVVEPVANSLITPSPSLVSFTAVGSTDNIDQSQLGTTDSLSFSTTAQYQAQQIITTKSKFTGVTFYKKSNIGSPTGTMTFILVNDNAGNPGSTVYATVTLSNATYLAIPDNTEFTVNLPSTIPAGTYWVKPNYSISSGTDYPRIGALNGAGSYSGLYKFGTDGITYGSTFAGDAFFKTRYYKPTTNFKASQNNLSVSVSADEDGFLNGSVINLQTGTASFTETFGTFYLLQYTISGSDLIAKVQLPGVSLSGTVTSDKSLEYSTDGITYGATFPVGATKIWVKILSYAGLSSFLYSIQFSTSGINTLRNYPTNKDIIKQYATTLSGATTSATYRATKWGFPAIEYSATEYQFLDVDTTATGSTVAFSELGTTYTTVADGASLAISSTSTPNIFVKANITANRIYSSSNDFNASSDKDGSLKQNITYQVVQ